MSDILTHANKKETYEEFVKKFEGKKTTDDCYTPPEIMEAVNEWVTKEYGLSGREFIRPFYPGGDYEHCEYKAGCVVVDNPPFSIISKIVDFYTERNIPFFLFAPALTPVCRTNVSIVFIDKQIRYENGATVKTCFVTNLEKVNQWRTAPDLNEKIKEVMQKIYHDPRQTRTWPADIIDAARLMKMCNRGCEVRIYTDAFQRCDSKTNKDHFGVCWKLKPFETLEVIRKETEHGIRI